MKLENIKELVSNSPLVEIKYCYNNEIRFAYAECSFYSLTGSIKDRVAYQIISDAYTMGHIKRGDHLVEVSSGNMGISLSAIANITENPITILMPAHMSDERKKLLKLYGANLIEVDSFKSAFEKCNELKNNGYFCTSQFDNFSNIKAHYNITGENIINRLKFKPLSHFVAGIGTSGTLMGAGKRLKEARNSKITAIEPENARIISGVTPLHPHKLQGLSDEILPSIYNSDIVDNIVQISDDDAIAMSQKLCRELSLGVGISSGANFLGCVLSGNHSATVFPDDNKKYLSTDLSTPITTKLVDSIELIGIRYL